MGLFDFVSNEVAAARRKAEAKERVRQKRQRFEEFVRSHSQAPVIQQMAADAARQPRPANLDTERTHNPLRYLALVQHAISKDWDIPEECLEGWPGPEAQGGALATGQGQQGLGVPSIANRLAQVQDVGYLQGMSAIRQQGRQANLDQKMVEQIGRTLAARDELADRLAHSVDTEEHLHDRMHAHQVAAIRRRAELDAIQNDPNLLLPDHLKPKPPVVPQSGETVLPAGVSSSLDYDLIGESALDILMRAEAEGWITPEDVWRQRLPEASRKAEAPGAPGAEIAKLAERARTEAGY